MTLTPNKQSAPGQGSNHECECCSELPGLFGVFPYYHAVALLSIYKVSSNRMNHRTIREMIVMRVGVPRQSRGALNPSCMAMPWIHCNLSAGTAFHVNMYLHVCTYCVDSSQQQFSETGIDVTQGKFITGQQIGEVHSLHSLPFLCFLVNLLHLAVDQHLCWNQSGRQDIERLWTDLITH